MEEADDYLLQAIVETVVLVIFLGITYLFGLWDIFKAVSYTHLDVYKRQM